MKTLIEQTWHTASSKAVIAPPKDGDYLLFRVDDRSDRNVYGGVDNEGNLLLAIEVKSLPPLIDIRSTALDYFRQERKGGGAWLMLFRLLRPELRPVFGRLCQDLIDEILGAVSDEALLEVVRKRISLWQRLFEDGSDGLLADFQVKGLIAELLFMESQIAGGFRSLSEAAEGWVGPSGADQDFIFTDESVEVKAIGPNSAGVSISSLQQLESMVPLHLSIWTLRTASPSELRAETLNDVVARIERLLAQEPAALSLFRDALLEAGYVVLPRYSELAFEPMLAEDFPVDDSFPKLTASSVPAGITSATYVISLHEIRAQGKQ